VTAAGIGPRNPALASGPQGAQLAVEITNSYEKRLQRCLNGWEDMSSSTLAHVGQGAKIGLAAWMASCISVVLHLRELTVAIRFCR
jgi:hypothetical protein